MAETKYVSWTLIDYTDPSYFPDYYHYTDSDNYVGDIPKSGSARVTSGSAGVTEYKTASVVGAVTSRFQWNGTGWDRVKSWSNPDTFPYNEGGFSGNLPWTGADAFPDKPPLSEGQGKSTDYTTTRTLDSVVCYYGGNLTSGDTRLWAQDYYGLVTKVVTRPNDFYWTTSKVSGGDFNLTADEWNALMTRIQDFREYKIGDRPSYTIAYKGNTFYYYMFNEAVTTIERMNSNVPFTVYTGDTIYADDLNWLVRALNEIY